MAARLHMGVEQLRALEAGDGQALPEPVFVVAQARRVAASLGLNIDADIAALRSGQAGLARPAPVAHAELTSPPAAAASGRARLTLTLISAIAAVAAIGLGAAGLWGVVQGWGRGRNQPQPPVPAKAGAPATNRPVAARQPELVLQAREPSWLEVRRGDDTVLFRGTFLGERRFPLTGELQVLAGRPDLVIVSPSGEAPRPLGTIESVAWSRFSPPLSQARPSVPAP